MSDVTNSQPTSNRDVERERRSGCAIAAALALAGSLLGYAVFSGQYATCAKTAGSEAGFWCLLPAIGMSLAIVIATAAAAIVAFVVTANVLGSSTALRRLAPSLLAVACIAIGLYALVSVTPGTGGPSTPTGLWSPANDADRALVDRLLTVWTQRDTAAVPELYAADARLIPNPHSYDAKDAANLGFYAPPWVDRRGIVQAVSLSNTAFTRVGPVTVTGDRVRGLRPLPDGSRYVHWVTKKRGQWFEYVVVLGRDGKIHDHYIDEYYGPELRQEFGFQQFEGVDAGPVPS